MMTQIGGVSSLLDVRGKNYPANVSLRGLSRNGSKRVATPKQQHGISGEQVRRRLKTLKNRQWQPPPNRRIVRENRHRQLRQPFFAIVL